VQIPSPARFAALPLPKLAVCLREGYPARLLAGDLLAGVTVGLVALPRVLLFAMSLTRHIPLAILAGILLVVAYDMGEWREIPGVIRLGPAEAAVGGSPQP
jgi:SulP family sulfate permease